MGGGYYKYALRILIKILTGPTEIIFLLTGRALRDPASWLSLLFESVYGCGLHRAFYVKEYWGERILCRYLQGMQLST
jgi:hypothetical protein